MAKDSPIEWTHHTFNPWWGCIKVSAACDNCYAETWAKRLGENVWGVKTERRFFSEAHWKEPLKWDSEARFEGTRRRVFCASMGDVFEKNPTLVPHRQRLLKEDLGEKFKDANDPLRLVFVCAMWITGFDVPTCSTIYPPAWLP